MKKKNKSIIIIIVFNTIHHISTGISGSISVLELRNQILKFAP